LRQGKRIEGAAKRNLEQGAIRDVTSVARLVPRRGEMFSNKKKGCKGGS